MRLAFQIVKERTAFQLCTFAKNAELNGRPANAIDRFQESGIGYQGSVKKLADLDALLPIPDPCPLIPDPGGADRDRTDDPLLAKQVLSQLSYSPRVSGIPDPGGSGWIRTIDPRLIKTVL